MQAVREAADRLGMPSDTREELKAVVHKLDGFDPEAAWQAYLADPTTTIAYPLHSGYFGVAESFKEHAEIPLEVQSARCGTVLAARRVRYIPRSGPES